MKNSSSLKPAMVRIGIALAMLAATAGFLVFKKSKAPQQGLYDVTQVPATCTDPGYSLYTNREDGSTYVDDVIPAPGHNWGAWHNQNASAGLQPTVENRLCSVCGTEEEQVLYPEFPLPLVTLEGDLTGIGKTEEVAVNAEFVSAETNFTAYATLKYQGHDALRYDKKNYTLKLYRDKDRDEKYKMTFSHWNEENKYILKANYSDPSLCRNLVCADVWAEITSQRSSLPEEMKTLSNYGAVDGFPVVLYINREFQGLYTWTLHKDDDLFGMKKGKSHAILIANDASAPEAFFGKKLPSPAPPPWKWNSAARKTTSGQRTSSMF